MRVRDRIMIIEDEKNIAGFIKASLISNEYDAMIVQSGREALMLISSHCPDLIILDLGLPDMDGLEIITNIRSWTQLPILVVSARSNEKDKVSALELGADDYVTKPFSTAELLARIRVALRHRLSSATTFRNEGCFQAGELTVDYEKHQVLIAGENRKLTQNEFRIVSLLSRYAGKVLTYDYIMKELWGPQSGNGNQILRVNMANIRRKIERNPAEPQYIFTEVGVGYRMIEGEHDSGKII